MRTKTGGPTPTQRAIDEQSKSAFPEPVKDKFGEKVPGLWANKRRRTETILNEAVDKNRDTVNQKESSKAKKKKRRRRRRGPKVYYVRFNP